MQYRRKQQNNDGQGKEPYPIHGFKPNEYRPAMLILAPVSLTREATKSYLNISTYSASERPKKA
jgi:hypothetical protein